MDFWISLDFWISDWISADSVRDFFRGGPLGIGEQSESPRILGPSVIGAPLAMLHGSRSLVVTCRGYQCQMWALQSIGAKQQKFKTEVN